jgi:NadR type nicotinamide-nucleotide adenylyltransferase
VHLCEVAQRMCDELVIVVGSMPGEAIDGAQRVAWMRELMPRARVEHLAQVMPQQPSDHPEFWPMWRAALLRFGKPDRVFTSDDYGERLAAELGATWICIDPTREIFGTSGTAIRAAPFDHWERIPRCVRPHFARRISVFGPESTGKSTLARQLADELETICVPEFARAYLEGRGGKLERADLAVIRDGQIALEDSLARDANRTLICDTDPLLTSVWSDVLHAEPLDVAPRRYDLTLLCDVDLPWVADPVRYLPDDRAGFFARCETALRDAGRRYAIIRGTDRLAAAREAMR